MSFILEALKKSEADRQRQSGPALFEVKVAPPRTGLPLWAAAIAVLLGVNLVIAAWMLLRSEEHTSELQSRLHLVCRLLLEKKKVTLRTIRINGYIFASVHTGLFRQHDTSRRSGTVNAAQYKPL